MDEFLPPAERERRATQFERLRQTPGMSVSEYAREFTRLSRYAPHMVPTEATKVRRFRAGLITSLYNVLVVAEYSTLFRLVDTAKQVEVRHREDQVEREQRRMSMGKAPSRTEKTARVGRQVEQFTYAVPPTLSYEKKRKSPI